MAYHLLVFCHVLAAVVWIGAGLLVQLLAVMADRRSDGPMFAALLRYSSRLGLTVFVPASLSVFVFGVLVVLDGPWTFGSLWIVVALAGFAATFLTGGLVLKPRADRLAAMTPGDVVLGPEAMVAARRLMVLGRLDYVVLLVVLFDMVARPTGDDVGALAGMALALVLGVGAVVLASRKE